MWRSARWIIFSVWVFACVKFSLYIQAACRVVKMFQCYWNNRILIIGFNLIFMMRPCFSFLIFSIKRNTAVWLENDSTKRIRCEFFPLIPNILKNWGVYSDHSCTNFGWCYFENFTAQNSGFLEFRESDSSACLINTELRRLEDFLK